MKPILVALSLVLLMTGCSSDEEADTDGKVYGFLKHNPRGAWFKIKKDDPKLINAAKTVSRTLSQGETAEFKRIQDAERQIVAGSNYRFVVQLQNGDYYYAVVFLNLQGNYVVSKLERMELINKTPQQKTETTPE